MGQMATGARPAQGQQSRGTGGPMGGGGLDLGDARPQLGWGVHAAPLACTGEPGRAPTPGPQQPPLSPTAGMCPLKWLARASVHEAGDHWDWFRRPRAAACPTGSLAASPAGRGLRCSSRGDLRVPARGDGDAHVAPTLPWVRSPLPRAGPRADLHQCHTGVTLLE